MVTKKPATFEVGSTNLTRFATLVILAGLAVHVHVAPIALNGLVGKFLHFFLLA